MNKKIQNFINKKNKRPLVCLTAYSKNMSKILDKYCDMILVGDSVANVIYGMKNTHNLSLEIMTMHGSSVKKGINKSLFVVDMPKNTYKNKIDAKKNALKIINICKCDAVKLESNGKNFKIIKYLVESGIPVMGHIGFTPQFKKKFKPQGLIKKQHNKLIIESKEIEKAGAFSIVLECITSKTSKEITKLLKIPTIGIGSSVYCDGQILVTEDILGLSGFLPKFVKKYLDLNKLIVKGVQKYKKEVNKKLFPKKSNSY
jgi:3-methyl-2-oxobutanoate hydroxymethyltransferase